MATQAFLYCLPFCMFVRDDPDLACAVSWHGSPWSVPRSGSEALRQTGSERRTTCSLIEGIPLKDARNSSWELIETLFRDVRTAHGSRKKRLPGCSLGLLLLPRCSKSIGTIVDDSKNGHRCEVERTVAIGSAEEKSTMISFCCVYLFQ